MRRREPGTGTIEERTNRDGSKSYRARVMLPDGRASSPWFDDPDAAEAFGIKLRTSGRKGEVRAKAGRTLADWWGEYVAHLEALRKPRAVHYERVWRQHVCRYPIADMPLEAIDPRACRSFVEALLRAKVANGTRTIAPGTAQQTWAIFAAALSAAVERELIPNNPTKKVKVEWPESNDETLDYWEPDEIARVLSCEEIPLPDRLVIQFYLGTGIRAGEGVWMPLSDLERAVARGELLIRYGSKGRKPKSGKTRTIPLLPVARDAAERWLAQLGTWAPENPQRLAFPTKRGGVRGTTAVLGSRVVRGEYVARFVEHQTSARVHRIVWHGLRHTCGAALASGWWGRIWSLHELRDLLGHSSVTTTERVYGHLAPSALRAAAEATTGGTAALSRASPAGPEKTANPAESQRPNCLHFLPDEPSSFGWLREVRDIAGLRAAVDARLASGWRPAPAESEAIARTALDLDPVAHAAYAVLYAEPEHQARRLIDLLELLPTVAAGGARHVG